MVLGADYRVHPLGHYIEQHFVERWEGTWNYWNIGSFSGFLNCTDGPEGADKRYKIRFFDGETGFQLTDATTIRLVFEALNGSTIPVVGDDVAPDSGSVELNVQSWKTDYRETLIALNVTAESCIIDGFKLTGSERGLTVYSDNAQISNSTITGNFIGIQLTSSDNVIIRDNTVVSNDDEGIYIENSRNGIIKNNNVSKNQYGIWLSSSSDNFIYNNYLDNTQGDAYDDNINIWNISKTPGTNILGGSWLGGNYWSDYTGEDTNVDGLGDTLLPYNSTDGVKIGGDWLPLVQVGFGPPVIRSYIPTYPAKDKEGAQRTFSITINQLANVSWLINGKVVQTNTSVTAASYTNMSAEIGTWNVSVIVRNSNGTDMRTWIWNVYLTLDKPVININTGEDFATIQAAIDDSDTRAGHTILAYAGIYYENVVINKPIILRGEHRDTTIIDGRWKGDVITVNNINSGCVDGFTITNGSGISYTDSICSLRNCIIENCEAGNYKGILNI